MTVIPLDADFSPAIMTLSAGNVQGINAASLRATASQSARRGRRFHRLHRRGVRIRQAVVTTTQHRRLAKRTITNVKNEAARYATGAISGTTMKLENVEVPM